VWLARGPTDEDIRRLLLAVEVKRRGADAAAVGDSNAEQLTMVCAPCTQACSGFFDIETKKITICENRHSNNRIEFRNVVKHELVHAYDDAHGLRGRPTPMDWKDCQQRACSEVRAAALSGDCTYPAELQRGNVNPFGFFERCVRRRAALSLAMQEDCRATADCDTETVFAECMADRRPFGGGSGGGGGGGVGGGGGGSDGGQHVAHQGSSHRQGTSVGGDGAGSREAGAAGSAATSTTCDKSGERRER
jgi:hypothetical protein